jgi:hypothetical protein
LAKPTTGPVGFEPTTYGLERQPSKRDFPNENKGKWSETPHHVDLRNATRLLTFCQGFWECSRLQFGKSGNFPGTIYRCNWLDTQEQPFAFVAMYRRHSPIVRADPLGCHDTVLWEQISLPTGTRAARPHPRDSQSRTRLSPPPLAALAGADAPGPTPAVKPRARLTYRARAQSDRTVLVLVIAALGYKH